MIRLWTWIGRLIVYLEFIAGVAIGYWLALLDTPAWPKLLAVVGKASAPLGALILSELLIDSPRWQRFVIGPVSRFVSGAQVLIPFGAIFGCIALPVMLPLLSRIADAYAVPIQMPRLPELRSASITNFVMLAVLSGLGILLKFLFEDFVESPKIERLRKPLIRFRILGFTLIMLGMIADLAAAIMELPINLS